MRSIIVAAFVKTLCAVPFPRSLISQNSRVDFVKSWRKNALVSNLKLRASSSHALLQCRGRVFRVTFLMGLLLFWVRFLAAYVFHRFPRVTQNKESLQKRELILANWIHSWPNFRCFKKAFVNRPPFTPSTSERTFSLHDLFSGRSFVIFCPPLFRPNQQNVKGFLSFFPFCGRKWFHQENCFV